MKKNYFLLTCLVFGLYSSNLKASLYIENNFGSTLVQGYFNITGTVTDEYHNPIVNASVLISELQKGMVTDNDGQFILQQVPNGNYTIEVRFLGKKTVVKKVRINNADEVLNIVLYNRSEELQEVTIEGHRNRNEVSKMTNSVSKMPLKAIEAPQVYSSISKEVLQNQLIYTVDDAYRNITGLQKMWTATNRAGDGGSFVNLRGFITNNSMRNGLVAPVTTSIDAINIEKLEVLKGPSATLFGSSATSYGGVINRVTKKPYDNFGGEVSLIAGSFNHYRVQADVNTPITKDKKLLFRINTAYTNSGSFQKKDAKNSYFAFIPSLTYNINDDLDINLEFEMFDTDAVSDQFFFYLSPALGVNNMNDVEKLGLDYKNSYMGDDLKTRAKVRNLFGQINYRINDHIKSSTNINTSFSQSDGFNPYFFLGTESMISQDPSDTEMGVIRSDQSTVDSKEKYFQIQQNFNFDYDFGDMRNRTVAGFDYLRNESDQMFIFLSAFDWVPFKGGDYSTMNSETLAAVYDALQNTPGYDFDANNTWPFIGTTNTYSGYISDVLTPTEGLNIMASLRYESNNFKGGKTGQADTPAYEQGAWSPKFGVVYEIIKDKFSVFGNYQNSFTSNGYYLANNSGDYTLSDPEKANQWESGLKANLIDGKVNATLSYYNIDVKNSLLYTGEYVGAQPVQKQAGSLTSKGVEFEVNAYLVKGFSLIAGLSYNDSEYTSTDALDANVYGRRPATASSPWLVNFNSGYQFQNGVLKGLGLGIGGNYASDNKIVNSNSEGIFILPEYFVLNANAFYDLQRFRFGVKVDNLTNEHYWIGYTTGNPQTTINAVGSIAYKF